MKTAEISFLAVDDALLPGIRRRLRAVNQVQLA
jgi:hypothetical protein